MSRQQIARIEAQGLRGLNRIEPVAASISMAEGAAVANSLLAPGAGLGADKAGTSRRNPLRAPKLTMVARSSMRLRIRSAMPSEIAELTSMATCGVR